MRPGSVVPIRFDMSALVHRSVASLYSHLVTRPTGRALRRGIEEQLGELGEICVSILDFEQVVVLDYSCADEAVAKLIQRYLEESRPVDAYFLARGVDEHHRETIEAVLARHGLALVAELVQEGFTLLGEVSALEREAWHALARVREAGPERLATEIAADQQEVASALVSLAARRLVVPRRETPGAYVSLPALIAETEG